MMNTYFGQDLLKKISIFIAIQFLFAFLVQAETFSVRCKFTNGQATDFDKSLPNTKKSNDMSELIFDQIDSTKNTARLVGSLGAQTVEMISGADLIHLIELTNAGNMNITTIFGTSKILSKKTFPVVHSRHIMLSSGPFPSQYLGLCDKLK